MRLAGFLRQIARVERSILLAIAATACLLYAFAELAEEMAEGDTRAFDTALLLLFRDPQSPSTPLGPPWLQELMRDITALGSVSVITLIVLAVFGFVYSAGRHAAAWTILLSVIGGAILSNFLKWGFARPRPDLVPHETLVYTYSFPSSHAVLSAVTYLTLGALLARTQPNPRVKVYLLVVAVILTILVGISRVFLGVHWPTDVLAGWAIGAAWSLFCWLLMLWLQARGKVQ